jgi:predicted nicotinamide N-methyase
MAPVRFRYSTVELDDIDIHLRTLRDNQQFDDPEGLAESLGISSAIWPLFGVLWESGKVLADSVKDLDVTGLRILEVGCGIGLASLLLNLRKADITASDHHPRADEFLLHNAELNSSQPIPFFRSNWSTDTSANGRFDLVIGSDLLYEPNHPELLSAFIDQHAQPIAKVIIVDPRRGNGPSFCKNMLRHGFEREQMELEGLGGADKAFRGKVYRFTR